MLLVWLPWVRPLIFLSRSLSGLDSFLSNSKTKKLDLNCEHGFDRQKASESHLKSAGWSALFSFSHGVAADAFCYQLTQDDSGWSCLGEAYISDIQYHHLLKGSDNIIKQLDKRLSDISPIKQN